MDPYIPNITTTLNNHILRIQLNRPQKKNALTPAMYDTLRESIKRWPQRNRCPSAIDEDTPP